VNSKLKSTCKSIQHWATACMATSGSDGRLVPHIPTSRGLPTTPADFFVIYRSLVRAWFL